MTDVSITDLRDTIGPVVRERKSNKVPQYIPLSSVWEGNDSDLLEQMFHF